MVDETTEEVKAEPKVEEPKVEVASAPEPEVAAPPPGAAPKWAMDRIAKLTARVRGAEAARTTGQPAPINPATGQQFTPDQINQMVSERAQVLANQQTFYHRCVEARSAGDAKYPDFKAKIDQLVALVDMTDPRAAQGYNNFLEAALETGKADKVIYMLGSDPDKAAKIFAMAPLKMAVELAKLSEDKGLPEPSKVPKPIVPGGSKSPITGVRPDDPDRGAELSTADWMRQRTAQAKERGIR